MAESEGTEQRQLRRKHVFVIDGSPLFLNAMRELLQSEEFNVTTTNYLPNTWEQIEASQPDLLVIDLAITHEVAWPLLEQLHEEATTRNLPILLTSTSPQLLERAQQQSAKYGEHLVVAKPFDIDVLLQAVNELIGEA